MAPLTHKSLSFTPIIGLTKFRRVLKLHAYNPNRIGSPKSETIVVRKSTLAGIIENKVFDFFQHKKT
jgi:hypothetical protein